MNSTVATSGETIIDISIRIYGSIAGAFAIALANGLAVSDELAAGDQVLLPELTTAERRVKTVGVDAPGAFAKAVNEYVASSQQNWLDVCLSLTGSVEKAVALAQLNGKAITDPVTSGEVVKWTDELVSDELVRDYFASRGYPATGKAQVEAIEPQVAGFEYELQIELG